VEKGAPLTGVCDAMQGRTDVADLEWLECHLARCFMMGETFYPAFHSVPAELAFLFLPVC